MNWNSQFDTMMKSWMDTQKQVWDSYTNSIQGVNQSQYKHAWESTLSMGEEMLRNILNTQQQGLTAWVDGLAKTDNVPGPIVESARQFQDMVSRWNKIQAEMVEKWFSMLKKFPPSVPGSDWTGMPETVLKNWRETAQGMMDAQSKWMNSWMEQRGKNDNE